MVIIFFIIGITLIFLGILLMKKRIIYEDGVIGFSLIGGAITVVTIVALCILLTLNINNSKKQNHIDMLVEENAKIEEAVDIIVRNYCQHENEVYTELIGDNVMFVITLYPQLASSELVSKEIDLYVENNAEIKRLKAELIYASTINFWLYFGR